MIRLYPALVFLLGILAANSALAHSPAVSSFDLQQILAAPDVVIDNQEINRDELTQFYTTRDWKPLWDFDDSNAAKKLDAWLATCSVLIATHGLEEKDYTFSALRKQATEGNTEEKTKAELRLTDNLLQLAHDLHGDSNDLDLFYPGWHFERAKVDILALLTTGIAKDDLGGTLQTLTSHQPAYLNLIKALQDYRMIEASGGWPITIPPGPSLRPGDHDPRAKQIRARLIAENYQVAAASAHPSIYDDELSQAVAAYQTRNGLKADGHAGEMTIKTMNIPVATRIIQIRANMERWRHMPDDFPPQRYAVVNIPDYSITIIEDGQPIYTGIVIVGRADRRTPFIQSQIRSMIVNPLWHVPIKIAQKDILPKLRKDPQYLEKLGFIIVGREHDPAGTTIDWEKMRTKDFNFKLRQASGDFNSLGRLKFDFDNEFAVYMHGTPHQELFEKAERALSSGCVRLHDPERVGEIVMSGNASEWNADRITTLINEGKTHWYQVLKPLPLTILYWTVFADEKGDINFRKDIYDYDQSLMQNLEQPFLTH